MNGSMMHCLKKIQEIQKIFHPFIISIIFKTLKFKQNMIPQAFDYHAPGTIPEGIGLLKKNMAMQEKSSQAAIVYYL